MKYPIIKIKATRFPELSYCHWAGDWRFVDSILYRESGGGFIGQIYKTEKEILCDVERFYNERFL